MYFNKLVHLFSIFFSEILVTFNNFNILSSEVLGGVIIHERIFFFQIKKNARRNKTHWKNALYYVCFIYVSKSIICSSSECSFIFIFIDFYVFLDQ